MRGPVGLHLGGAALAVTLAAVLTDRAPEVEAVLTWRDASIEESSGLVETGRHLLTVNDSGSDPVVYVVDRGTGETTGRTTYTSDEVVDVEALSPGPDGSVWVGDIGDNTASRDVVSVYRLPALGTGDETLEATRYDLTYQGGPRDAEALLVHPVTGRVHVVSKGILGGRVYRAPARLRQDRSNLLTPVGRAPAWVTDGAFLPDGRHAVVRTYGAATLYELPRWRAVGEMRLPDQPQGEGLAVGRPPTSVLVSTEGRRTPVLSVPLPAELLDELVPASVDQVAAPGQQEAVEAPSRRPLVAGAAVALALAAAGLWVALRRRRTGS